MFSIDGKEYDVSILFIPEEGIERKFNILDGNNAGRLQAKGKMYRDIIGTFFTYVIKIDTNRLDPQEYDELYETISDPNVDSHTPVVPYGQSSLTFEAYITSGSDKLSRRVNGINYWEGLSLEFVSMQAIR